MAALQALGTVSYNGFTFGPETETTAVSIKPVPDSAGRTVVGVYYSFTIKTIVFRSAAAIALDVADGITPSDDDTFEVIRRQLTAYGGEFRYQKKGLGDVQINVAGGRPDLAWGPKPEEISWKTKGGGVAAELVLRISFQTIDCSNAIMRFGVKEFCYTIEFEHGRDRTTRRTYSGHLIIPQTRANGVNDKTLTDSADLYYEKIVPFLPDGWRRENERRKVSEDKCRLDFTFTDIQLLAPLVEGCIDHDWDHEQTNVKPVQMYVKSGRISAWYDVALDWPLSIAQFHFDSLWMEKLNELRNDGNTVVPQHYTARETGRARRMTFNVSYLLIRPVPLLDILGPQGFYQPAPTADNAKWAASMAVGNRPRGYTSDVVHPADDVIIDLCRPGNAKLVPIPGGVPGFIGGILEGADEENCPEPENSWIDWQCWLEFSTDDGIVEHKPLPTQPPKEPGPHSLGEQIAEQLWGNGNDFTPEDQNGSSGGSITEQTPSLLQRRTSPITHVWLVGYAMRLCYGIPEPILTQYLGVDTIPMNRSEKEYFQTRRWARCITIARWRRRYALSGPLDQEVKPLDTPYAHDCKDGANGKK